MKSSTQGSLASHPALSPLVWPVLTLEMESSETHRRPSLALELDILSGTRPDDHGGYRGQRAAAPLKRCFAAVAVAEALGFGLWLGPTSAFDVITTGVLFGLVTTHSLMNISLMRLSSGERRTVQVFFHVVLPIVAMGLFWLVLYESVVPLSFPLAWAAVAWAAVLVASIAWARRATAHTDMDGAAGRDLGNDSALPSPALEPAPAGDEPRGELTR